MGRGDERVRGAGRGRPWRNLLGLGFVAVWAACAVVLARGPSPAGRVACVLLAGGMLTGLDLVLHEAAHGVLLRGRRANRWVGFLAGAPGLVSITAYRHYHLRHHAQPLRRAAGEWWVNGTPLYLLAAPWLAWREGDARRRRDVAWEYAALLGGAAAVGWGAHRGGWGRVLVDAWVLPFAVSVGLNAYRGWTETFAAIAVDHEDARGRPILAEGWMRLMSGHLEHHLHPARPWHAMAEASARLRADRARERPEGSYLRYLWDRVERRTAGARGPGANATRREGRP